MEIATYEACTSLTTVFDENNQWTRMSVYWICEHYKNNNFCRVFKEEGYYYFGIESVEGTKWSVVVRFNTLDRLVKFMKYFKFDFLPSFGVADAYFILGLSLELYDVFTLSKECLISIEQNIEFINKKQNQHIEDRPPPEQFSPCMIL